MKKLFLDNSMSLIQQYNSNLDDMDVKRLRYGLEGIYLTVTKLVVIILLSLVLGIFKEVVVTMFFFNILRYTGFGVHAETSKSCLITSTLFFILIPYIVFQIELTTILKIIVVSLSELSFFLYAPADTIKRPLKNKKKKIKLKLATMLIGFIYGLGIFLLSQSFLQYTLTIALIIQSIVVNPLTYRILNVSFNNG